MKIIQISPGKHVQIMKIIQIPLVETYADHADLSDTTWRTCADHALVPT